MQKRELEKIKKKLLLYSSVLVIGAGIASCEEKYERKEKPKSLVKEIGNGREERFNITRYGSRNGE